MDRENPHLIELDTTEKQLSLKYLPAPERQRLLARRLHVKRRIWLWNFLSELCRSKNFGYEDHHTA